MHVAGLLNVGVMPRASCRTFCDLDMDLYRDLDPFLSEVKRLTDLCYWSRRLFLGLIFFPLKPVYLVPKKRVGPYFYVSMYKKSSRSNLNRLLVDTTCLSLRDIKRRIINYKAVRVLTTILSYI